MTDEYNPDLIREAIKGLDLRTRMEFEVADAHHPKSHVTARTTGIRDLITNPWTDDLANQVGYWRGYGNELFEEYLRVYLPKYAKPQLPTVPGIYVTGSGFYKDPSDLVRNRVFKLLGAAGWREHGLNADYTVQELNERGATFYRLGVIEEDDND